MQTARTFIGTPAPSRGEVVGALRDISEAVRAHLETLAPVDRNVSGLAAALARADNILARA